MINNNSQQKECCQKVANLINLEINNYKTNKINLAEKTSYNQYDIVQKIITHQNKGFLTELASNQDNDRESYDIITPMVETGVANIDLDVDNIDLYTDNPDYLAQEKIAKTKLRDFCRKTNQGVVLNDLLYQFVDDGNVIIRRVDNSGELFRAVLPQNLYVIDQTARTLEDTTVIEKQIMTNAEVRNMKDWANKDLVFEYYNFAKNGPTPYYEVYYRYGEYSKQELQKIKKELFNEGDGSFNEGVDDEIIQTLIIMVSAKNDNEKNQYTSSEANNGIIVFAEELIPEKIEVAKNLYITRYKPYESVGFGKYNGRFWRYGYRETGIPYQNRANELGNQIREIMRVASKMVFWSSDTTIAGKNVLSAIKNGQILMARDLQLLNNVFPNLSLFAEEWNRNIRECEKALKNFEVASGETLPSSTSATAVAVQNQAVGKYYSLKREIFGLFLAIVYKRFVLPKLLKAVSDDDIVELIGDADDIDSIIDWHINGWIKENYLKTIVFQLSQNVDANIPYKEQLEQLKELKKQEILKQPKKFIKIAKDFFKGVEMYVGINITGEPFNKQAKISNMLQLLQFETDKNAITNTINDIKKMLGLKIASSPISQPMSLQEPVKNILDTLPLKEPSLTEEQKLTQELQANML